MKAGYFGIDLTSSPARPSACAALTGDLRLAYLGKLSQDSHILSAIEDCRPRIVAIDAPLGLPRGLHCLEEACRCQPLSPAKGRLCERELAQLGIPCYFTTKRSIIKRMVYRAIGLRQELERRSYRVIEVYPYGSKVRLWGKPIPPKTAPQGLNFLRQKLTSLVPDVASVADRLDHDLADAVVAAYTAYLFDRARAQCLGVAEEGILCLPL